MLASNALSQQTNGRLNQQLNSELQQRAGVIANDVGTRSAAAGAAGFDANVLAQLNASDLMQNQYLDKRAGAIDGYLDMSRKTQRDIQSIDARTETSRQQRATQAAQIQQRYEQRTMDFRMDNPVYRGSAPLLDYDLALAADNAMWGDGKNKTALKRIATSATMVVAYPLVTAGAYVRPSITGYSETSESARYELLKFRDGIPGTTVYQIGSDGSNELSKSDYYQELSQHVVTKLDQYYNGNIPDGLTGIKQRNIGAQFRPYNPKDAAIDFLADGIKMSDVVGSMTYGIEISTRNGMAVFKGVNAMTLQSFSGQNILKHNLVNNKSTGMMMTSKEVFEWEYPLPKGAK